jgi:DEAD/DEAH box helicase domain-containing protein
MLHITILPDHKQWKRIFMNLEFILLDEVHMYKGAFGSHIAAIIRRKNEIISIILFDLSYIFIFSYICCNFIQ